MYLKEYPPGDEDEDLPRKVVHEAVNPRWEVCITVSPSGFQQASFVNSIATTKVSGRVCSIVNKTHNLLYLGLKIDALRPAYTRGLPGDLSKYG